VEVILAKAGELRRTAVAGIVDRVDAADHIFPVVGSAVGAAISRRAEFLRRACHQRTEPSKGKSHHKKVRIAVKKLF
jgi:hypothetical protein